MNLKQETLDILAEHGKNISNIKGILGNSFQIPVDNFLNISDIDYDNGYGRVEVARDLKIIGDDFVMIRQSYDGAECWCFISTRLPKQIVEIDCVTISQALEKDEDFEEEFYASSVFDLEFYPLLLHLNR